MDGGYVNYGVWGIVLGECFMFPHVLMILLSALSLADGRLYEATQSMVAISVKFFTITLPSVKYGLVSAILVKVFTLVITDFWCTKGDWW